ncbi:pentapeptide repeat-containing protein [Ferrimonas marina]|uniref:Uncharacterized protein YjbI, contains pentapeptide repeats n=1 Tax=Ferrimonas marina TaxID=299255 RepID=A0A1M5YTH6_9GAMM|nr:pentapeptide repeat-containing protein [Ferrimonas marina]SHI15382.1 Uncharacterized protein YjbI, contains pentapeptide repeats [Ferrimonas marina]
MEDKQRYDDQTFRQVQASGQAWQGITFDQCQFIDCDFSEIQWHRCVFIDCQFLRCNLNLAQLGFSQFREVAFEHCRMLGLDWTRVNWPRLVPFAPIRFDQCLLSESSFAGLKLNGLQMVECKAHNVDFQQGHFVEADFQHSDFSGSIFHQSNLTLANFAEAQNYRINLYDNTLSGARFTRFDALGLLEDLDIELLD